MTKEEEITALTKKKKSYKIELSGHLSQADTCKTFITQINKRINWLSHLIRKGE